MGPVNGGEAPPSTMALGNGASDPKYDDKKRINNAQNQHNKNLNRKLPTNGAQRMPVRPVFGQKPQQPATSTQTLRNPQMPAFRPQSCLAPHYLSHHRYPTATQQPLPVPPPYNTFPPTITNLPPRAPTTSPPSQQHSSGANSSGGSSHASDQLSKTNLYIRGLTQNTTDKDLFNLCSPYGPIISTKAILDKQTNKCKGYGFVDFESPVAAEAAVKALSTQGVQAQMAKQQEQDPTNLYLANLPPFMTEQELEEMLSPYGTVISTRILRDPAMNSRGVGFARMDTRDMCEMIIQRFNGKLLAGCKESLLVKFADGGNKRRNQFKNQDQRLWHERSEALQLYDQTTINQNGVASQLVSPLGSYQRSYSTPVSPYQLQPGPAHATHPAAAHTAWLATQGPTQYIVQPTQLPTMIPSSLDPLHYGHIMPQITAHLSQLQLSGTSYMTGATPGYPGGASGAAHHPHLYPQAAAHLLAAQAPQLALQEN
ncbi:RNA-binding motif, single-stranded-interacting protein 2-like [Uloborus diversus]|uniref:RNA-binding motif, single-stranded-interacting protein 2-like n=1 Tax=Uloborus diversus TaxID=327109 RepID=UPI002408FF1A|nr:RNA-binding motif, single-stranded-interacting protein 2-like [Uloborus diversus]